VDPGLIGGIVGGVLGVLGGAIGTYFSIKNTAGPRERNFMVRVAILAWVAVSAFVLGLLMLPRPFNFLLWVPYAILLPLGILWCNRRQRTIRSEEGASGAVRNEAH
jgi:uncharacterized membrane protein